MGILSPKWYAAISIEERVNQLRHYISSTEEKDNKEYQRTKIQQYIGEWRNQPPFNEDGYFDLRLNLLALDEKKLAEVLCCSLSTLQKTFGSHPPWLQKLEFVFTKYRSTEWLIEQENKIVDNPMIGFLAIVAPIIQDATQNLDRAVDELIRNHAAPFAYQTIKPILVDYLQNGVLDIIKKTLILELKIAKNLGKLNGETPEDRFASFINLITQPNEALNILGTYPILVKQVIVHTENWLTSNLLFMQRLCNDYEELQNTFSTKDILLGKLVSIKSQLSDSHRKGQTVIIAKFESGVNVVYKPKSLLIDSRFQQLLAWFTTKQNSISFCLTKFLIREDYGWCEYFEASSCHSIPAIERFYIRMGAYLAILYSLKATDFHGENIIAAGEHPVLIDLESLFHNYPAKVEHRQANNLVVKYILSSVLATGLLPEKIWGDANAALDASGLGATRTQSEPIQGAILEGVGTDEIKLRYGFIENQHNIQSRPMIDGHEVDLRNYVKFVEQGFVTFYRLILEHQENYLGLVEDLFHDCLIRCLIRPTQLYYIIRQESYNPRYQRDSLEQNKLLDKLWLHTKENKQLINAIPSERQDMEIGDIPIFTTYVNSCDLWDSNNNKLPGFFEKSGLQLATKTIRRFDETDLQRQLWFIHTTTSTLSKPVNKPLFIDNLANKNSCNIIEEKLLKTSCDIVEQYLQPLATKSEDTLAWLAFSMDARKGWRPSLANMNLYDGLGGIALFLAYLGYVTEQDHYTHLAEGAVKSMRLQIQHNLPHFKPIGGFDGWGSVIYSLSHLGSLWEREDLLEDAVRIARILPALIKKDGYLDIIAGSAGCIPPLLNLFQIYPEKDILNIALLCGEHLLTTSTKMSNGVGWKNHIAKDKPLSGFSHGAAGIAWALLHLADFTGIESFHKTALQAIAYERSTFDPNANNWHDVRLSSETSIPTQSIHHHAMAWCHGAPGIGLGRVLSFPYLDDDFIEQEIDIALKTTLEHGFGIYHPGFGQNYSLCHGDLGNLDIVLEASLRLKKYAGLKHEIYKWAAIILDNTKHHGLLCGVPHGLMTPGLMTGIAGIGYALLRLAAPEKVPSILALDPPASIMSKKFEDTNAMASYKN